MVVFFIHQLGTCLVLSLQMDFFSTNPPLCHHPSDTEGGGDDFFFSFFFKNHPLDFFHPFDTPPKKFQSTHSRLSNGWLQHSTLITISVRNPGNLGKFLKGNLHNTKGIYNQRPRGFWE